jgi:hypothetical protein
MKSISRSTVLALLAPLTLALGFAGDELRFHPKADSEVAKKLKIDLDFELKNLSIKMNGETVSPEDMDMGDSHLLVNMSVGATDKYVDTKDGKPIDLRRTFGDMSLETRAGDEKNSVESFGAISGKTVRFKWNEDSKSYDKSFHESKCDDETIADLNEDMDLRVLLPDKTVAVGDTWEVSGEHLVPLFLPGGLVGKPHSGEEGEAFQVAEEELTGKLGAALKDFRVTCKYKGLRDDGDAKYADIRIAFEGKADLDLSELATRLSQIGEDDGLKPDIAAKLSMALKGEGGLEWDQAAGRIHAFEMQVEITANFEADIKLDLDGEHFEQSFKGDVLGTGKWELSLGK